LRLRFRKFVVVVVGDCWIVFVVMNLVAMAMSQLRQAYMFLAMTMACRGGVM
jgi:hypothetical protein